MNPFRTTFYLQLGLCGCSANDLTAVLSRVLCSDTMDDHLPDILLVDEFILVALSDALPFFGPIHCGADLCYLTDKDSVLPGTDAYIL